MIRNLYFKFANLFAISIYLPVQFCVEWIIVAITYELNYFIMLQILKQVRTFPWCWAIMVCMSTIQIKNKINYFYKYFLYLEHLNLEHFNYTCLTGRNRHWFRAITFLCVVVFAFSVDSLAQLACRKTLINFAWNCSMILVNWTCSIKKGVINYVLIIFDIL